MFGLKRNAKTDVYNPISYWNARSDPNNEAGRAHERVATDVDFIGKHVGELKSIFELGPGVGRTFRAYKAGANVTSLDISKAYADQLSAAAAEAGVVLQQHCQAGLLDRFPFDDASFEVGVACQVMLHQPPDVFAHSIREMSRICAKLVIISGFHSTFPQSATKAIGAPHVFSHDYIWALCELGRSCADVRSAHEIIYICAV